VDEMASQVNHRGRQAALSAIEMANLMKKIK
jgi:6,7-dimethyl-8-ribityllumazine synthase